MDYRRCRRSPRSGPGAAPRSGRQGRQDQGRSRALHPFPLCYGGEGLAVIGKDKVIAGIQETRDQMQIIHDQTYRTIALGMDAQGAAEMIYLPKAIRKNKETYGQVESHVKRVYGARIGWMGWDVYDINPLSKARFSSQAVAAMGGAKKALKKAKSLERQENIGRVAVVAIPDLTTAAVGQ